MNEKKNDKPKMQVVPEVQSEDIRKMFVLLCQQYSQMGEQLKVLGDMFGLYLEQGGEGNAKTPRR